MSTIEPWAVTSGGLHPVKLQVSEDDFENAKRIVDDYREQNSTE
jgi:hypothetical protein